MNNNNFGFCWSVLRVSLYAVWAVGLVWMCTIPQGLAQTTVEAGQLDRNGVELLVGLSSPDMRISSWPDGVLRVKKITGSPIYRIWVLGDHMEAIRAKLDSQDVVDFVEKAEILHVPEAKASARVLDQYLVQGDSGSGPYDWLQAVHAGDLAALGRGKGAVVAVVDTGLDMVNPEMSARVWSNPGERAGNGLDEDGNGYIDDKRGWDFGGDDPSVQDVQGHGTLVSSIILTLAPDVRLMPLKVSKEGQGRFSTGNVVEAVYYALQAQADVINLSFAGAGYSPSIHMAVQDAQEAGIVVVAAAGNSEERVEFPARLPETIAVGALNMQGYRAAFSSFGCELDLLAPGAGIIVRGLNKDWLRVSGTSFSAAMVSGAAAVAGSMNPHLTPGSVLWMLKGRKRSTPQGPLLECFFPVSRLDGRKILDAALPQPKLTALDGDFSDAQGHVGLHILLPPTHAPTRLFFGLLHNKKWFWLTRNRGLQHSDSEIPSLGEVKSLDQNVSVPVFGPNGLFPALQRKQLAGQSFKLLLALVDRHNRVLTPVVATSLELQE